MKLAPDEETREAIKFWLDCLQIVTVIVAIVTAYITFHNYTSEQGARATEQADRARAQEQHAKEQLAATKLELARPYEEKKLALYLDAARVLAHLAASPDVDKEKTEARFWELYWGELAFVESEFKDEASGQNKPSVERLMVEFCHTYFSPEKCTAQGGPGGAQKSQRTPIEAAAIEMAHQASREIRDRAEHISK
jgi:hypothetical protein